MRQAKAFFCIIIFILTAGIQPALALDLSAESAVLCDAASGRILYSKNADSRMLIASTTKIMTALVAIDSTELDSVVVVKHESTLAEGSSMYLRTGERLTVKELLYGLMLSSGNDAALAIADYCGGEGGVGRFVDMMNARARELGMNDTHFANPNGLDAKDHFSTSSDMAKLAAAAMENETFSSIVSTKSIALSNRYLRNHNKLLWTYTGASGIKTGFTKNAGRTLVSAAEREGRRLIAVTLNAPNDWNDHRKLFDHGFLTYPLVALAGGGDSEFDLHVISGETDSVTVRADKEVLYPLTDTERQNVGSTVYLPRFVYAPLTKGQQVGEVRYYLDGDLIGEVCLLASEDVPEIVIKKPGFAERFLGLFKR